MFGREVFSAELAESYALRDALVAFHLWGDIDAALSVAREIIDRGTLVDGGERAWNMAMNYVYGSVHGIHPSHPQEVIDAYHAQWREQTIREYGRATL